MRFSATSIIPAACFALLVATSVAHAEPNKPDEHPAKPAPAHHTTVHRNVVVHRTVVNRNVHVNEHVNERVVGRPVVAGPIGRPGVVAARWHSGDRFAGDRRVYSDYGRYHLRAPAPGYGWVQDGNELVLINLGSGVIGDTFLIP